MPKKIIILIAMMIVFGVFYWLSLNSPVNQNGSALAFIVAKGESAGQVAKNLRQQNLIKSTFYFKYRLEQSRLKIQAGEYFLSPSQSTKAIIKILTSGEALNQEKSIRLIEGWSSKDIGAYLEKNNIVSAKDFLALAKASFKEWRFNFSKPGFLNDAPESADLEGFLFPDTYRIFKDTVAEEIIYKMLANFDKKMTLEMRQEISRQKKTVYEIVTLASIIEKEVRSVADMKIVAGIFSDRIKNGQPLESCATLAYILGVNKAQYTLEDTKINSPYNTYKYRGLPPGPIANPGLNAIKAAIYPVYTEYNYFLSDPATGKTIYSKTLEEHNINKAKYLK